MGWGGDCQVRRVVARAMPDDSSQPSVLMFMTQIHAVHDSKILGLRWTDSAHTEQNNAMQRH